MQSHRAIVGSLLERATHAGLENVSSPILNGIISDFLREILFIDPNDVSDSNIEKVAGEMEENILHGAIKIESAEANQYPQILYQQNELELPLLRSSSMITELAPLVLFIRHKVQKRDLLIIEEPEAHLHPEAQRKVATAIVQLIRAGIRVLVTTHSAYFLEQLANHVRLSKLNESQRSKSSYGDNAFLEDSEITAYSFHQNENGTVVKRLSFDDDGELSPEDHAEVSSDLYNESVRLQRDVIKNKEKEK